MAQRELASGFSAEFDRISETDWYEALRTFDDANLYHTWAHASVLAGESNASRTIIRRLGTIVAMVQVRIATVPFLKAGIAYVRWGPVWKKRDVPVDPETLTQTLRAIHAEYVGRRKLVLRVLPYLFNDDPPDLLAAFERAGFVATRVPAVSRTILMDISPSIGELRSSLGRNWRRNLRTAEQRGLKIEFGTSIAMFDEFIRIYREMVSRKGFAEPNDIRKFRAIQAVLPEPEKMKIMLCRSDATLCAGLIWSEIGGTAIELFAATSDLGLDARGSYLLRWCLVDKLKTAGFRTYNLNGINPDANPGGYRFKTELAGRHGRDVRFVGRLDARGPSISSACIAHADRLRNGYYDVQQFGKSFVRSIRRGLDPRKAVGQHAAE